jgi:short-subunit dehydrogenase
MDMNNIFAVVTGASSGIGYHLARVFAENGFDLLVTSEDDRIEAVAQELKSLGTSVQFEQADLATYEGVEQLWQAIQDSGRQSMLLP